VSIVGVGRGGGVYGSGEGGYHSSSHPSGSYSKTVTGKGHLTVPVICFDWVGIRGKEGQGGNLSAAMFDRSPLHGSHLLVVVWPN
jgi:hypothetical protein